MRIAPVVSLSLLVACTSTSSPPASPGAAPAGSAAGETRSFKAAGPQSFTPEAKPKRRERAVRQLWSARIGKTDHRTTMAFVDGAVWVGVGRTANAPSGIAVVDGKTGTLRTNLAVGAGDVVGIAFEGDAVYASTTAGEVVGLTKAGKVTMRAKLRGPAVSAPMLVDIDGDGAPEVAAVDSTDRLTVLDAKTGKPRWTRDATEAKRTASTVGMASADIDGDGAPEIVVGSEAGELAMLRARSGEAIWRTAHPSALRAAPLLVDVDANGKLEVVAAWADGDVAIFDAQTGRSKWSAKVEKDDGDPAGLLASPTPIPGGGIVAPTARWGDDDVFVLRAHDRAYRTRQGSVVTSPVLGVLGSGTPVEAAMGTRSGDVIALDAAGGFTLLYHVAGSIEAPLLIADIEGNGLQELVLATASGALTALAIHSPTPPLMGRARGASLRNDGVLPPIDLGWRLP